MNQLPRKVSLRTQTAGVILEEITNGRWERWLPGEHELCGQLHISRKTLRAALQELQARGIISCSHGKRREIIGRPKRRKPSSQRVVFLTPVPLHSLPPFAIFLIDRLRGHLAEEGFLLEIHSGRVPYRARRSRQSQMLEDTLHPAGWVLSQSTAAMQKWFAERKVPCVLVGSSYPGITIPSVDTDYAAVCNHAVGQFVARGHRSLALINPSSGAAGDEQSEEAFLAAVSRAKEKTHAKIIRHDETVENLCVRIDGLLLQEVPPTALLVSRAQHTLTVLSHLAGRGIRVPKDVAVISRDDDCFLENVVPNPARYSVNAELFATKLSRAVSQIVRGEPAASQQIMPKFLRGKTLA